MTCIGIIIENVNQKAGIERAATNLANMLSDTYSISIISLYSRPDLPTGFQLNPEVSVIHMGYRLKKSQGSAKRFWYYARFKNQIRKVVRDNHFEVLISTTHALNCLLAIVNIAGVRKIGCEHFNYEMCPSLWRRIRKACYPKLDDVVLLTEHDARKYTFLNNKCVIPNSLPFNSDQVSDCKNKRIIAVGRLVAQKGFDLLLKTISNIKEQMDGWSVDIFGEGADQDQLLRMSCDLGVQDIVHFRGYSSDVRKEMLCSSIYLLTSRFEGFGLVLIEAQVCGLPIVAFDCTEGPSEIVEDGKNGYLIPTFDTDMMGQKLLSLMQNEEKRIEFGKNAKQHSNLYTTEAIKKKWLELLKK